MASFNETRSALENSSSSSTVSGPQDDIKLENLQRFRRTRWFSGWGITRSDPIRIESSLQNTLITGTAALEFVMMDKHPHLMRVVQRGAMGRWLSAHEHGDTWYPESYTEWHVDLANELQPLLAHLSAQRTQGKRVSRHRKNLRASAVANTILHEMEQMEHIHECDEVTLRPMHWTEALDAIEMMPLPGSTIYQLLRRTPHGPSMLNHMLFTLVRIASGGYFSDAFYVSRPRYYRDGKEVKKKWKGRSWQYVDDADLEELPSDDESQKERDRKMRPVRPEAQAAPIQEDSVQKEENTTFNDQRETIQESGYLAGQINSTGTMSVAEDQWHVRNIMAKPLPFLQMNWSTSDEVGKDLKQLLIPGDTLLSQHAALCQTFTFFRGHPRIRIQLNGTKFHNGRLLVVFVPREDRGYFDHLLFDYNNMVSMPHVMLDASFSNTGLLELPFVHGEMYFNTGKLRNWQTLGTLHFYVFNRLSAASTATQSLSLTAWISYENCELHQPCESHALYLPKTAKLQRPFAQGAASSRPRQRRWTSIKKWNSKERLLFAELEDLMNDPIALRNLLRAMEVVERPAAQAEALLTAALPSVIQSVQNTVPKIGDVLGGNRNTDKPTDPIEIDRWVPNAVTSLNFGDGSDKSNRLGLQRVGFTAPSSDIISTTRDDMNLLELCKIPCRIRSEPWKSSQTATTEIMCVPVYPSYCKNVTKGSGTGINTLYQWKPSMLAYISRAFRYWRGPINYKIQVIASMQHSGRLLVSYGATPSETTFSMAASLNTIIIDLQEKAEVEFTVDFMCEKPWLRSDMFVKNDEYEATTANQQSTGFVRVFVLNQLAHPDSVASSVDINLFVSAGDGFELAVPTDLYLVDAIGSPVPAGRPVAQSQATVTTRTDDNSMSLTKGSGVAPASDVTMGENCMDLKTLLRRYSLAYTNTSTDAGSFLLSIPNHPCLTGVDKIFDSNAMQCRTLLSHFSQMYAYWRGTLRYKMVFMNSAEVPRVIRVVHVPGVYKTAIWRKTSPPDHELWWQRAITTIGTVVATTTIQNSVEFEIPFYTHFTQLQVSQSGWSAINTTGSIFIWIQDIPMTSPHFNFSLYQAAGDDFALNYLRSAPMLQMKGEDDRNLDMSATSQYTTDAFPTPNTIASITKMLSNFNFEDDEAKESERPFAQGLGDWIKPNCIKKFEKLCDTAQGMCDATKDAVSAAVSSCSSGGSDDESPPSDDDDSDSAPSGFSLHVIGEWLKGIFGSLKELLVRLPKSLAGITLPKIDISVISLPNIISALTSYISCSNVFTRALALFSLVKEVIGSAATQFYDAMIKMFTNLFDGRKKPNERPDAQAGVDTLLGPISGVFTTSLFILALGRLPGTKEMNETMSTLSNKLRFFNFTTLALNNIPKLYTCISETVQWMYEWLLEKVFPQKLPEIALLEGFSDVEEWALFVDSIKVDTVQDRCNYDLSFKDKCLRAADRAKHYRALMIQGGLGRSERFIMKLTEKALEVKDLVLDCASVLPVRADPFCVALHGESRIGKGGCIADMAYRVMDNLNYPQLNRWCPMNPTETFFTENYNSQAALYIDDFGTVNKDEQYFNFFNLKSNTSFPLNMAFKKGKYFNSESIWMTTNIPYPSPNIVNHQPALLNRRDVLIEARAKPEYVSEHGTVNYQADFSHLEFRFRHPADQQVTFTSWLSYNATIDVLTWKMRTHVQAQRIKVYQDLRRMNYTVQPYESLPVIPQPPFWFGDEPVAQASDSDDEDEFHDPPANTDNPIIRQERAAAKLDTKHFATFVHAERHRVLGQFSEELFNHIEYNGACFSLKENASTDIIEEYLELVHTCSIFAREERISCSLTDIAHTAHQYYLNEISTFDLKNCPTVPTHTPGGILERLATLKNTLQERITSFWKSCKSLMPILSAFIKACFIFALGGIIMCLIGEAAHACLCATVTFFNYRCGLCGKWPKLPGNPNKAAWLQSEWRSIYGDLPYQPGKITSIDEENTLRVMRQLDTLTKIRAGTDAEAHGRYGNTEVSGQKVAPKIFAQNVKLHSANQHTFDVLDLFAEAQVNVKHPHSSLTGVMIGGRDCLLPTHFFKELKDGDLFQLYHDHAWVDVAFDLRKLRQIPNKDACLYEMPPQIHAYKDKVKHFISESDLPYVKKVDSSLVKLTGGKTMVFAGTAQAIRSIEYDLKNPDCSVTPILIQNAFTYTDIPVVAGDCGSVLICHSSRVSGVVLGIHVAGTSAQGYTTLITREMLNSLRQNSIQKLGTPAPAAQAHFSNLVPQGHFGRIGTVSPAEMIVQSDKSQIIPTTIHNEVFETVVGPSVLHARDPRLAKKVSPLKKGIEKYGTTVPPFPRKDLDLIEEYLKSEVARFPKAREPTRLTLRENIQGIPEIEGYEKLPMDTSPGWPYVLSRPKYEKGKKYLFDVELGEIVDEELKSKLSARRDLANLGERVTSVWTDCLKDERRPLEKISSGSTRVFTIPPVDFSLLLRECTMDFAVATKNARHFSFTKVGIDAQSLEWTALFNWLSAKSNLCIAGDFSRYDGTIPAELIMMFFRIIYYFYTNSDDPELDRDLYNSLMVLGDEIVHTVQLAKDQLYVTHIGNPSGNPLTVILNSFVNIMYMLLAWLGTMRTTNPQYCSVASFFDHVRAAVYGDDNLLSITAEVIDIFNQETISDYLQRYSITYTNESKSGVTKYKPLLDATFLKNGFAHHQEYNHLMVPLMSETTIHELLNWTRIAPDQDELLLDNIHDSLRFAYFYGKQYFTTLRIKIIEALSHHDLNFSVKTYSDYDQWFLHVCGML